MSGDHPIYVTEPEPLPQLRVTCPECGRVFRLDDENDASEWWAGHDCEA